MEKYDRIGLAYNQTRTADPYLASQLRRFLNPKPNGIYLDVGCGTGNYTVALAARGGKFIGLDPSEQMLSQAQLKPTEVKWIQGKAESIPLPDGHLDGVVGTLTLHHWKDLPAGFREIHRVLKPGGRLVFFTASPEQMQGYWLNHFFPKMLEASIMQMPRLETLLQAIQIAGLTFEQIHPYSIQPDLQDLFLYCGKDLPERYLDPAIRNGISSFADLALADEVAYGLSALEAAIGSGEIDAIRTSYDHDLGDYLFFTASKPI
jgi:ubiquinone/menaquinone biosynthesis C-methylase UbiE